MPTVIVRMGEVPPIVEECDDLAALHCGVCCHYRLRYDCPIAVVVCLTQTVTAGVLGA